MRIHCDDTAGVRQLSPYVSCTIAAIALAAAMGIGGFAFTPLLPLMVREGVLAQDAGAALAASNYLGYLIGAIAASRIAVSLGAVQARH